MDCNLLPYLLILLAYLIGSIPTSVWVGRLIYRKDVREYGSGNAGATNMIRVLGYKAGVPVLLFDIFKGWIAVNLYRIIPETCIVADEIMVFQVSYGLASVAGHVFSVFLRFTGGKGVATLTGVGIALFSAQLLPLVAVFVLTFLLTRYVSLSSILAAISLPITQIFIYDQHHPALLLLSVLVAIAVPLTHRKNILRLFKGEESKFFKWKRKSQ